MEVEREKAKKENGNDAGSCCSTARLARTSRTRKGRPQSGHLASGSIGAPSPSASVAASKGQLSARRQLLAADPNHLWPVACWTRAACATSQSIWSSGAAAAAASLPMNGCSPIGSARCLHANCARLARLAAQQRVESWRLRNGHNNHRRRPRELSAPAPSWRRLRVCHSEDEKSRNWKLAQIGQHWPMLRARASFRPKPKV